MLTTTRKLLYSLGNILTLGGFGKLKNARTKYHNAFENHKGLETQLEDLNNQKRKLLTEIDCAASLAMDAVERAEKIFKFKHRKPRSVPSDIAANNSESVIVRIDKLNDSYSSFLAAGTSAAGGGTLLAGSWALVSIAGAASTGTAISTLSGIAATNATLAWFGGGAIAAGGAGIAGGSAVLIGLVLASILVIFGILIHRNARNIEHSCQYIKERVPKLSAEIELLRQDVKRMLVDKKIICDSCSETVHAVNVTCESLYPRRWLSRGYKRIKGFLFGQMFTEIELAEIENLKGKISQFLDVFEGSP